MDFRRAMVGFGFVWPLFAILIAGGSAHAGEAGNRLRAELERGNVRDVLTPLMAMARSGDDEARLALGLGQFTHAVEKLAASLYRHGMKSVQNPFLPVLRLPIPQNSNGEQVSYEQIRDHYRIFINDLATARETLATVRESDTKIVLDLNLVTLRIMPDQTATGRQDPLTGRPMSPVLRLSDLVNPAQRWRRPPAIPSVSWEVAFDRSDAIWVTGYAHVLSGMFEFILAHDWRSTYDATAHLFFSGAKAPAGMASSAASPPEPTTMERQPGRSDLGRMHEVADQIAFIHLIRWPAGDKAGMKRSHDHFKRAIANSREMWKSVLAETDDDREWLPSPKQSSRAVPALPIDDATVSSWMTVLDDFDAILDGRKLLGHWRFEKGIDMKMFFEQPQPFDLVTWVTGHGAVPFLKDGPVVDGLAWQRWNQLFSGNFLGYAIFIN